PESCPPRSVGLLVRVSGHAPQQAGAHRVPAIRTRTIARERRSAPSIGLHPSNRSTGREGKTMLVETRSVTLEELDGMQALELPPREMLGLVTITITNVLNNLS